MVDRSSVILPELCFRGVMSQLAGTSSNVAPVTLYQSGWLAVSWRWLLRVASEFRALLRRRSWRHGSRLRPRSCAAARAGTNAPTTVRAPIRNHEAARSFARWTASIPISVHFHVSVNLRDLHLSVRPCSDGIGYGAGSHRAECGDEDEGKEGNDRFHCALQSAWSQPAGTSSTGRR